MPQNVRQNQIKFKRNEQMPDENKPRVDKNKIPVFRVHNRRGNKSVCTSIPVNKLKEANKLKLIETTHNEKENFNANVNKLEDHETTFQQLEQPILAVNRKPMAKIEKDIGIRKWLKAETPMNNSKSYFRSDSFISNEESEIEVRSPDDNKAPYLSAKKTSELFSKAREALSLPENQSSDIFSTMLKEHPKVREIQPMQKRVSLWKPKPVHENSLVQVPSDIHSSPKLESPKQRSSAEIPFSRNRYGKEANHDELKHENQKKAIEFLKKQKQNKVEKQQERKKLLERKKQYQEKVRKINKEKLK